MSAKRAGLDCVAYLPTTNTQRDFSVTIVKSIIGRASPSAWSIFRQTFWCVSQLRIDKPDIVVAFSLRACLVLAMSKMFLRRTKTIYVITGLGFLAAEDRQYRLSKFILLKFLRLHGHSNSSHFIFENMHDAQLVAGQDARISKSVIMGAGVDFNKLPLHPKFTGGKLRLAFVGRLVWSKGLDIAIDAVIALKAEGYDVELNIYGAPDIENPRPVNIAQVPKLPYVIFHGHVDNISDIWRDNHAGLFPSRGGEGLPRALLEASACGRPSVVSCVPGCIDFVSDQTIGIVVKANSVSSLKSGIIELLKTEDRGRSMGLEARRKVERVSSYESIMGAYDRLFANS